MLPLVYALPKGCWHHPCTSVLLAACAAGAVMWVLMTWIGTLAATVPCRLIRINNSPLHHATKNSAALHF